VNLKSLSPFRKLTCKDKIASRGLRKDFLRGHVRKSIVNTGRGCETTILA
jgi:hypothetical protein